MHSNFGFDLKTVDDGQTPDHGYTINSPGQQAYGSGELRIGKSQNEDLCMIAFCRDQVKAT